MSYEYDKVRGQLAFRYSCAARTLAAIGRVEEAMEGLGLLDAEFYADFGDGDYVNGKSIPGPYVKLSPKHLMGISFNYGSLSIMDTTPTLGDAAMILLPKIGRWEKSFDETFNLIRLTGEYKGVRIVLEDTPPDTCTIRKVEEDVEVPEKVIAAHTEKKVRYVMEGDCDPLATAREVQAESVENIPADVKNSLDNSSAQV